MKKKILVILLLSSYLILFLSAYSFAQPGGQIKLKDNRWINIGGALRTSFTSVEDNAPSGSDNDATFDYYINYSIYVFFF